MAGKDLQCISTDTGGHIPNDGSLKTFPSGLVSAGRSTIPTWHTWNNGENLMSRGYITVKPAWETTRNRQDKSVLMSEARGTAASSSKETPHTGETPPKDPKPKDPEKTPDPELQLDPKPTSDSQEPTTAPKEPTLKPKETPASDPQPKSAEPEVGQLDLLAAIVDLAQ